MKHKLPPDTVIEVVMTKQMPLSDYHKSRKDAIAKGWSCQGYQTGFYQDSNKIEI